MKYSTVTHLVDMALVVVLLTGCSSVAVDPNADANHPANPRAAQTPYEPPPDVLHPAPAARAVPGATVYACPMHPQVVQPQPGQCPICHMDLVPQRAAEQPAQHTPQGGGHEHH